MRGIAALARRELLLTKIDRVPTGRAIAAEFNGIRRESICPIRHGKKDATGVLL
jgi:hypothetical protein